MKKTKPNKKSIKNKPAMKLPIFATPVVAGFPSPAEDIVESKLDLNELIVENPSSTFYLRVKGDSMNLAGIFPDDILVVDRSAKLKNNSIVIAVVDGEFTVKRIVKRAENNYELIPESTNSSYKPIKISKNLSNVLIWGIVTYVISKKNC